MKKLVYGAFALAAIALSAIGCQKEVKNAQVQGEQAKEQMLVKFNFLPSTRADETTKFTSETVQNTIIQKIDEKCTNIGFIFIKTVGTDDVIEGYTVEASTYTAGGSTDSRFKQYTKGVKIQVSPSATKVVGLLNVNLEDAKYQPKKGEKYSDYLARALTQVSTNTEILASPFSSDATAIDTFNASNKTDYANAIGGPVKDGERFATLSLSPVLAVMQIEGMTFKPELAESERFVTTEELATPVTNFKKADFKLSKIFLNNYSTEYQLDAVGKYYDEAKKTYSNIKYVDLTTHAAFTTNFATNYPTKANSYVEPMVDFMFEDTKKTVTDGLTYVAQAGDNKVWGFNVVPQLSTDANENLHVEILLKFNNDKLIEKKTGDSVTQSALFAGDADGVRIVTVRGIKDASSNAVIPVERGKIYTFSTENLVFSEKNIGNTGNDKTTDLWILAKVTYWQEVAVKPNL